MNPKVEHIKRLMAETNISQTELAKRSGIAFGTLNRILNGKQVLQPNTAKKIADALGLNLIDLMDDEVAIPQQNYNIQGYLEYNGEITKITSLKQLEKWLTDLKEENEIPQQAKLIIKQNETNRRNIKKNNPNQSYHFNIEDFEAIDTYDATSLDCWAWKTADDEKDGVRLDLGNQCSGYEFDFMGEHFFTNESLYLCGQFSQEPTEELKRIQYQLLYEKNGYTAKKKIKNAHRDLIRSDWDEVAPHWMMYVCWQKCLHNQQFAELLKSIPRDAILLENSTTIHEGTSVLWGAKNKEIEEARNIVARAAELQYLKQCRKNGIRPNKADMEQRATEARNTIHYIGQYSGGKNYMGKILKRCQLALLDGTTPKIDTDLLRSKKIYLFGKLLTFAEE